LIERRDLLVILGAGFVPGSLRAQQPAFFSSDERTTVEALMDILVPPDEQSPGAREAGVSVLLDAALAKASAAEQSLWRKGLGDFDDVARGMFGVPLLKSTTEQLHSFVAILAENELAPKREADHFFAVFKWRVVDLYCATDLGRTQYLGYRGDTVLAEFPGCTHAEHKA
jgi:Gluconate 2-dehydrogenase subunit 3